MAPDKYGVVDHGDEVYEGKRLLVDETFPKFVDALAEAAYRASETEEATSVTLVQYAGENAYVKQMLVQIDPETGTISTMQRKIWAKLLRKLSED